MIDTIGIRIKVTTIPEYVAYARLRDELAMMHPIRRWLSFRKRRKLQRLRAEANTALIMRAIQEGEQCLTNS